MFVDQEFRIADVLNLDPAHHLTNDDFDVLIIDVDTLQTIDLLNFVHKVSLQFFFTENGQNIMRITRTIHQRLAGTHMFAFLNVHVNATRQSVFALDSVLVDDHNLPLALGDIAVLHDTVDFSDDRGLAGFSRFKQFNDARQTTRDVFGLRRFTRNLRQDVALVNRVAVGHHQVSTRWNQIFAQDFVLVVTNLNRWLAFLIR